MGEDTVADFDFYEDPVSGKTVRLYMKNSENEYSELSPGLLWVYSSNNKSRSIIRDGQIELYHDNNNYTIIRGDGIELKSNGSISYGYTGTFQIYWTKLIFVSGILVGYENVSH